MPCGNKFVYNAAIKNYYCIVTINIKDTGIILVSLKKYYFYLQ